MQDRQPGAPGQYKAVITAAEFQKMQAGSQFVITMTRDDQPIVKGTPYSKAAVLPDSLAALICPSILDPTPADALRALQNGKAPAGYGLGGAATAITVNTLSDLDTVTAIGWYRFTLPEMIQEAGVYMRYVYMRVDAFGPTSFTQTLYVVDAGGTRLVRKFSSDAFSEWCVENPIMTAGVEYRTAKRWKGKTVYTKLINLGTMPSNSSKTVDINADITNVVGFDVYATNDQFTNKFPWISGAGVIRGSAYVTGAALVITTFDEAASNFTGTACIEYTKD